MMAKDIQCIGKVQGVFFRASTRGKARRLGIDGYVRNEQDGTVFIHAEGEEEQLLQLVEWCKEGPSQAIVEEVKAKDSMVNGFQTFEIRP